MSAADAPLSELAQRLAQKQSELEEARSAYESRLADLTRRREERQAQLPDVDGEIQAVPAPARAGKPAQPPKAAPAGKRASANGKAATQAAAPAPPAGKTGRTSLTDLLTQLLRASDRPLKARELADRALAAGYQTASKD